jgi:PAS domain S-box-containing protein
MNTSENKACLKEKHFQTLVEKTSEGLALLDQSLKIIYINPAVEVMSGFRFADLDAVADIDLIHPDEWNNASELFVKSMENPGVSFKGQMRARHKDGYYRWIEGIITNLLNDNDVNAFVINFRDITERKEAERIIDEMNESLEQKVQARTSQLEEANRELEAFTYSVSHDLRAPLRAVNGYAKLLQEECADRLSEDGKSFVETIRSNAANMGHLIDELLEFSKLGRKKISSSKVDMSSLARTIKQEISISMPHRAEIIIDHLPSIEADQTLIHQLLFNLVSNAVKYSSKAPQPKIVIASEEKNEEIIYWVRDNGAGFDMRHADKLFGVFSRLHTNAEFEGVGVGLAIVQRIVDKFGGKVWAEGRINEGATFYFSFDKKMMA